MGKKIITTNRKAFHDFTIFEKYTAGIVLTGTEIKSVRRNAVNLKDSFAKIEDGEVFLYGAHISPYEQGNRYNHKPDRIRKLLLNKKEILKIHTKVKSFMTKEKLLLKRHKNVISQDKLKDKVKKCIIKMIFF